MPKSPSNENHIVIERLKLAIDGGPKVRPTPLPYRKLFGEAELESVTRVFEDSWQAGVDFGFGGKYEQLYPEAW